MARIDIDSPSGGGSVASGVLQLQNGVAMDATLRNVADQANTVSPLKLSTTIVQITSPLRITTSDASGFYLDAEDSATNNRFSIKRDPSSQQVTLDFASNPSGSTTNVGAIRTFRDGVNLSEAMTFREDGNVGIGTTNPFSLLTVNGQSSFASTQSAGVSSDFFFSDIHPNLTAGANNQVVSLLRLRDRGQASTGGFTGTQRLSLIMETAGGSGFPFQLFSESGALRIGFTSVATPTASVEIRGSGSTSATTSLLVQNGAGTQMIKVSDDGQLNVRSSIVLDLNTAVFDGSAWYQSVNNQSVNMYGDGGASSGVRVTGSTFGSGASQIQIKGATSISSGFNQPDASSQLDVSATTKGFLPPRMTTAQKNAIVTPAAGLMVYDTTLNKLCVYTGAAFETITSV